MSASIALRKAALLVSLSTACSLVGCGGAAQSSKASIGLAHTSDASDGQPLVELFSWWTAPGEAEALQALVDTHRAVHPTARLFNAAAASGVKAKETLHERIDNHDPPDMFQENVSDLRTAVNEHKADLQNLDDLFDDMHLRSVVFPEVIENVTMNGHVLAMPVNIHRENSLFYNKHIFEANHLSPPTSLDEFLSVCHTLKALGITPVATSFQGWILRIMFNEIAMGKMGSARYHAYFSGKSPDSIDSFREAVVVFKDVLNNYVNGDASEAGFNWTNAAQAVYSGDAAMFLHGDWAKGYLVRLGWRPGVDFGVTGAPGAEDTFLYGVDVFAIPKGAHNEIGARSFLRSIASTDGQVAFNELKGSSPIRSDAPTEKFDALGQSTLRDLRNARYRMLVRTRKVWDDAFMDFSATKDVDALVKVFTDNPPTE